MKRTPENPAMPLRDHFRGPCADLNLWEGFHSAWVNALVRHLNGSILSRHLRAFSQAQLGPDIKPDFTAFEREDGVLYSPPEAVQTLEGEWPGMETYEVRVVDERAGQLVAVIELVGPGNKDSLEERQMFAAKCAGHLREGVSVVIVDIVTSRQANLHTAVLELFSVKPEPQPDLYAVSYRASTKGKRFQLGLWPFPLTIGSPFPTVVPMWVGARAVPLCLELSYEETCRALRLG
jgi:hypothetical protein